MEPTRQRIQDSHSTHDLLNLSCTSSMSSNVSVSEFDGTRQEKQIWSQSSKAGRVVRYPYLPILLGCLGFCIFLINSIKHGLPPKTVCTERVSKTKGKRIWHFSTICPDWPKDFQERPLDFRPNYPNCAINCCGYPDGMVPSQSPRVSSNWSD